MSDRGETEAKKKTSWTCRVQCADVKAELSQSEQNCDSSFTPIRVDRRLGIKGPN
jgi:hypothetical protein